MNSVGVPEREPHVPAQARGKPRISLRKAADRRWSRQETMVWFSYTLTLTLLP
jgi:hypothetical protein